MLENLLWYAHSWGTLGVFVVIALSIAYVLNETEN